MIIDHWNPSQRRYRTETFCYGPLSCRLYSAGPTRKVPGRRGMQYVEEDWVDEDATSHRDSTSAQSQPAWSSSSVCRSAAERTRRSTRISPKG